MFKSRQALAHRPSMLRSPNSLLHSVPRSRISKNTCNQTVSIKCLPAPSIRAAADRAPTRLWRAAITEPPQRAKRNMCAQNWARIGGGRC